MKKLALLHSRDGRGLGPSKGRDGLVGAGLGSVRFGSSWVQFSHVSKSHDEICGIYVYSSSIYLLYIY